MNRLLIDRGIVLFLFILVTLISSSTATVSSFQEKLRNGILPPDQPVYDITCIVDQVYHECLSASMQEQNVTICPSLNTCLEYGSLTESNSINIKVKQGVYDRCGGLVRDDNDNQVMIISTFKSINIEPYNNDDGIVQFICSDEDQFLHFESTSMEKVTITINRINLQSTPTNNYFQLPCITVISSYGSLLHIQDSIFNNCRSSLTNGGTIDASGFYVVLNGSTISNSHSAMNGGAIASDEQIIVDQSTIKNCSALVSGGAFYTAELAISNTFLYLCKASISSVMQSNVTVVSTSVFLENYATYGGVISIGESNYFSAENSEFLQNFGAKVGVFEITSTSQTKFQAINCFFQSNNGTYAGVMKIDMPSAEPFTLNLTGSLFEFNSAGSIISGDDIEINSQFHIYSSIIGGRFRSYKPITPLYLESLNWVDVLTDQDCPISNPVRYILYTSKVKCGQVKGTCNNGYAKVNKNGRVISCTPYESSSSSSNGNSDSDSNSDYSSSTSSSYSFSFSDWSSNSDSSNDFPHFGSKTAAYIFTSIVAMFAMAFFFNIVIKGFRD